MNIRTLVTYMAVGGVLVVEVKKKKYLPRGALEKWHLLVKDG